MHFGGPLGSVEGLSRESEGWAVVISVESVGTGMVIRRGRGLGRDGVGDDDGGGDDDG